MSQGTASETPGPGAPNREEAIHGSAANASQPTRPDGQDPVKIGLWGPPQSGKTTYLAALPIAVSDGSTRNGSWIIFPQGTESRRLKQNFEKLLVEDQRFPEATVPNAPASLKWLFVGDLARSRFDRRKLRRGEMESRFVLDLIDVHGDAYLHNTETGGDPDKETAADAETANVASVALDHLAGAQGIIYLFDPIGERDNRDSAAYVRGTVNELLERAAANDQRPGRYLPHQVSVCITKFDHPELFHQAQAMHLVTKGPDGMPRVRDEDAEQFFNELCTGRFWSEHYEAGQQSAEYVRDQLRHIFRPDHIRYFVTSSIGFWIEPPSGDKATTRFNLDDFANYHDRDGKPAIKGKVRPINVLEPLISLQQRIAQG